MSADAKKKLVCAVYTRKSSEEGLEQEFNSLDARDLLPIIQRLKREEPNSLSGLARALNDMHVRTPRGESWSASQVARVKRIAAGLWIFDGGLLLLLRTQQTSCR